MQPGAVQPRSVACRTMRWPGEAMRFGAAEVERLLGVGVEHGQVVVGVAGQANDIRHREQGAPAVTAWAGGALELVEGGGDDHRDRQAAVLAEFGSPRKLRHRAARASCWRWGDCGRRGR